VFWPSITALSRIFHLLQYGADNSSLAFSIAPYLSVPLLTTTTTTSTGTTTAEPQTKGSSRTYLRCLFNARCVVNKLYEFQQLLCVKKYDLVFIIETWLHSNLANRLLDPRAIYTVYRKDRSGSHRGGLAILVHRNLCVMYVVCC